MQGCRDGWMDGLLDEQMIGHTQTEITSYTYECSLLKDAFLGKALARGAH